jgi:uncharacterized membrane protein YuzA (DUF378 family)
MTLTDPREALAEQSTFIGYLVGLAGLGQVVRALAADSVDHTGNSADADDFVYALIGLASLGSSIGRLAESACPQGETETTTPAEPAVTRWLR